MRNLKNNKKQIHKKSPKYKRKSDASKKTTHNKHYAIPKNIDVPPPTKKDSQNNDITV
jgi:hypothetical protein